MKRCPTCNQTFSEDWLSFCTQDGTALLDTSALPREPPATMMGPPLPPSVSPTEQPTMNLPGAYSPPPAISSQPFSEPQPMQQGWQPPPPPVYATGPQQTIAVTSLICGIFSITLGWCCSLGLITSPVAIVTGIVSLIQIKNDPVRNAGKPLAIAGIATGAAYLLFWMLLVFIYGMAIFMQGLK